MQEKRTAIKDPQQYYSKDTVFEGEYESNWHSYITNYLETSKHWDIPVEDKVLFHGYSLANESDTRQNYDGIKASKKEASTPMKWRSLFNLFAACFACVTKQTELSNRLDEIKLKDVRENDEDS